MKTTNQSIPDSGTVDTISPTLNPANDGDWTMNSSMNVEIAKLTVIHLLDVNPKRNADTSFERQFMTFINWKKMNTAKALVLAEAKRSSA